MPKSKRNRLVNMTQVSKKTREDKDKLFANIRETGMNGFIKSQLPKFAAAHPQIEISVSPRPAKHPTIVGHYINGNSRSLLVKNMQPMDILRAAESMRDTNGEKLRRANKPVTSINPSVRGIWSPYHGTGEAV
ncbi:hypothetical protein BN1723_001698 [Verticillium longisporum]|uniref:Large ribosomal subunit protein mL43 n=1 Tax=Verticillium longisporum TaxID=100787 RepID=A0A0G4KKB7_VERLO|nr:hypothetical protein BN1723_001698 [Verticillium longisporum]